MGERIGQQLGNYRLVQVLGRGGFAEVYLGKHVYLHSHAALKVVRTSLQDHDMQRFLAEAQTLVQLRHPHIVRVLEFFIEQATPVLVMDYAPWGSLRKLHPSGSQLPIATTLTYLKQVAAALQYAHNRHLIHRDVKPENMLLDPDQHLLLSDFGLALLSPSTELLSTQEMAGTLPYMAPEQLRGKPCFASDQYALGVVAYEWLCGRRPFEGSAWEIIHQHQEEAPPSLRAKRPDVPTSLEAVVLRALAKDPKQRFVSVQAFAHAFERASREEASHPGNDPEMTAPLKAVSAPPEGQPQRFLSSDLPLAPAHIEASTFNTLPVASEQTKEAKPPLSTARDQNRVRLLAKVRAFWIKGVLEQSLHGAALIAVGLREQPDAVAHPWRLVFQQPDADPHPLPAGTPILQVYDDAGGELLILGEPGSGKTTLLLDLARNLLDRAEREESHPIPVVFNLSSWAMKRQPILDWLVEELRSKYQVPRKRGRFWVSADQILPLLDGFDEVPPAARAACVEAINTYRQKHGLVPLVICSRTSEYLAQRTSVLLQSAVALQPLSTHQVDAYLMSGGASLWALRVALQQDAALRELTTTPLMLSVLSLAYHDRSVADILQGGVPTTRRQVFEHYTQRMLERRGAATCYTPQQTVHWLTWLAKQLTEHHQTEFYIERMQPNWLPKGWLRRLYSCCSRGLLGALFIALIAGVISGLLGTWTYSLVEDALGRPTSDHVYTWTDQWFGWALPTLERVLYYALGGLIVGVAGGLLIGLVGGLLIGLFKRKETEIKPAEVMVWSWVTLSRDMMASLVIGITGVFLMGVLGHFVGVFTDLAAHTSGSVSSVGVSFRLDPLSVKTFCSSAGFCTTMRTSTLQVLLPLLNSLFSNQLLNGLYFGLVGGLVSSFFSGKRRKYHAKTPQQRRWASLRIGVVVGLVDWLVGLPLAESVSRLLDRPLGGLLHWPIGESPRPLSLLVGGLIGVALCLLVGGLTFALFNGFSSGKLEKHLLAVPNEGIRRSARAGLLLGFLAGLMSILFCILGLLYAGAWSTESLLLGLFSGVVFAPVVGLLIGLLYGGAACMQHMLLRLFLWKRRWIPWNYTRFLDYAAERILLRKVGGGYIFVHRLLLEYFASLDEVPVANGQQSTLRG